MNKKEDENTPRITTGMDEMKSGTTPNIGIPDDGFESVHTGVANTLNKKPLKVSLDIVESVLFQSLPEGSNVPDRQELMRGVYESYGTLYPKSFQQYEGRFLWYQALGYQKGDENYETHKRNTEGQGTKFNEETLLRALLLLEID